MLLSLSLLLFGLFKVDKYTITVGDFLVNIGGKLGTTMAL
jgi:hypothetical protein